MYVRVHTHVKQEWKKHAAHDLVEVLLVVGLFFLYPGSLCLPRGLSTGAECGVGQLCMKDTAAIILRTSSNQDSSLFLRPKTEPGVSVNSHLSTVHGEDTARHHRANISS